MVEAVPGGLVLRADLLRPFPLPLLPASATDFFSPAYDGSFGFRLEAGRPAALEMPGEAPALRAAR